MNKIWLLLAVFSTMVLPGFDAIIVPEKKDPVTESAQEELLLHLEKRLRKKISVFTEGRSVSGKKIWLGDTAFARRAGIDFSTCGKEECLIVSRGNDLIIGGGIPRGVLYGVYEFLERFCQVSWLDPHTTVMPEGAPLLLPENIRLRLVPSFAYRGVFTTTLISFDRVNFLKHFLFRIRMRENIFFAERIPEDLRKKWGLTPVFGSPAPLNTLYHYIRRWPEKGMEEALSLDKNGKRLRPVNVDGPGHVCFSSPLARKTFIRQMKAFVAADRKKSPENPPDFYNLSINDTPEGNCHCSGCRALTKKYGTSSGAMLDFVNEVAREVAKTYPDVKIQTSAYFFTSVPPVGIKPEKNVYVRVSPIDVTFKGTCFTMLPFEAEKNIVSRENLTGWGKIGQVQVWNYWVNFGKEISNGGIVNAEVIAQNMKFFKKHNVSYVFSECEYNDISSFHPLRVFMGYQMKKDCSQSAAVLLEKFFSGFYGKAAMPMAQLYAYIKKRQAEHPHLNVRFASELNYLDKNFFRTTEKLLGDAENSAAGDRELLRRISLERTALDLARYMIRDRWTPGPGLPGRAVLRQRILTNHPAAVERYFSSKSLRKKKIKELLNKYYLPDEGAKYPLPPALKNKRIFEILPADFLSYGLVKNTGVSVENDPQAVSGKAVVLRKTPSGLPHKSLIACGIQSRYLKKSLVRKEIKTFRDENYHLHHLGRIDLTPKCLFWAHNSWLIQLGLDRWYMPGDENKYDVWLSFKSEGAAYVPASKKENALFIDRILLVKADGKKK